MDVIKALFIAGLITFGIYAFIFWIMPLMIILIFGGIFLIIALVAYQVTRMTKPPP